MDWTLTFSVAKDEKLAYGPVNGEGNLILPNTGDLVCEDWLPGGAARVVERRFTYAKEEWTGRPCVQVTVLLELVS